jgi:hypothetical protein
LGVVFQRASDILKMVLLFCSILGVPDTPWVDTSLICFLFIHHWWIDTSVFGHVLTLCTAYTALVEKQATFTVKGFAHRRFLV